MSTAKTPSDPIACAFPANDEELRKLLTPQQYYVVKQNGTEAPFNNAYWDNKQAGIYVDIISGEALFSSKDKFDSGTGWPSFTAPIKKGVLTSKTDSSHGMQRTEVRSSKSDAHLGHIFNDGPAPSGLRYCINSASLRFVPVEEMAEKGYGDLLFLFPSKDSPAENVSKKETATLAAGCFWGIEEKFRRIAGVLDTSVGYTGGHTKDPSYKDVCTDTTGHAEAVRIEFDPSQVTYSELLQAFFDMHDPSTLNRQGPDVGTQYRSAIFFHSPEQEAAAIALKEKLQTSSRYGRSIVTEIIPVGEFYKAEEYHQQYLQKNGAACGSSK